MRAKLVNESFKILRRPSEEEVKINWSVSTNIIDRSEEHIYEDIENGILFFKDLAELLARTQHPKNDKDTIVKIFIKILEENYKKRGNK